MSQSFENLVIIELYFFSKMNILLLSSSNYGQFGKGNGPIVTIPVHFLSL